MLVLALDTCFAACSVALYDAAEQRLLASECVAMERGHAETLPQLVAECFERTSLSPTQIKRIAVTRGPGSFTGLRVGLAFAHGMATGLECEVVGLSSLRAMAAPYLDAYPRLLVVQQAGATGQVFASVVTPDTAESDIQFVPPEQCVAMAEPGTAIMGSGMQAVLSAGATFRPLSAPAFPVAAAFAPYAVILPPALHLPQPLYLREPDAKPSAKTLGPEVQLATAAEAETFAKLHAASFDKPWTAADFAQFLTLPGNLAWLVLLDGHPRGLLQIQVAHDEAEILTIAVEPRWRGRGLARALLQSACNMLRVRSILRLHLEVAVDNAAAIHLYDRQGFKTTGRRKAYYKTSTGPATDAVTMTLAL